MNEEQAKIIAQGAVDDSQTVDQFGVAQTPFHTHNGSDSPTFPFLNLRDVPNSYYGSAGKVATVNPTGTGLIFSSPVSNVSSYGGSVVSNAAGTPFPAGWSVAHASGGRYTITHTLGTANFSVSIIVHGLNITIPTLTSKGSSTFAITTYNQTGSITWTGTDVDFDFIVSI